nr:DUF2256 and DUF3253 domain-containing protein [Frigoribacterium faeni]
MSAPPRGGRRSRRGLATTRSTPSPLDASEGGPLCRGRIPGPRAPRKRAPSRRPRTLPGTEAHHGGVSTPDDKTCRSCGRRIEWRKKWAANWDEVAYCSDACRRRKVTALDRQLEERIRELLAARAATSTICPSDVARSIAPDDEAAWRDLMEPVRRAARRLVAAGEVDITQGGSVVDPSTAKGPIRIRKRRAGGGR